VAVAGGWAAAGRARPARHPGGLAVLGQAAAPQGLLDLGDDLVEPGVVRIPEWRPDSDLDRINPAEVWGGVARKP